MIRIEAMEYTTNSIESLLDKANEYGKISIELIKLKALDKASDVVSSIVPNFVVFLLFASFMLFLNLGIALWLGELLEKIYYGFFVVAAFYIFLGIVVHLFMRKGLKKMVCNNLIKLMLK